MENPDFPKGKHNKLNTPIKSNFEQSSCPKFLRPIAVFTSLSAPVVNFIIYTALVLGIQPKSVWWLHTKWPHHRSTVGRPSQDSIQELSSGACRQRAVLSPNPLRIACFHRNNLTINLYKVYLYICVHVFGFYRVCSIELQ